MLSHLYEIILERARAYPEAAALGSEEGNGWRTLNSGQLLAMVDGLAAELRARGVTEGDRLVLWLPNTWRNAAYLFALWKLGAIPVPFDREMNPEGARMIIDMVAPRYVITGYDERPEWAPVDNVLEWWEPRPSIAVPATEWHRPAEELAALFFTSGTTGQPKGCMITHANLCSQIEVLAENIPLDPSCRLAGVLPLSHLFEFTCGLLYPLSQGAAVHYVPSLKGPDIVRVLQEQHATHLIAVPKLLSLMGRALDSQLRAKLPSFVYDAMMGLAPHLPMGARRRLFFMVHKKMGGRLIMFASGGAPLPLDVQHFWELLGVRVVEGYGTSECSPVVACGLPDGSTPPGTVGKPLRGVQVRMTAEGELCVKGPNVMRGYYHDEERTAEVLRDGWYYTGDLAQVDAQGNIKLCGRARDLIVLPSGMNVWPNDIEDVLRADEAVLDAAVLVTTGKHGRTRLHAYLVVAPGVETEGVNLRSLLNRANKRLAQHQRVSTASWWPDVDFPRTSTQKVKRHLLPSPDQLMAESKAYVDAETPGADWAVA